MFPAVVGRDLELLMLGYMFARCSLLPIKAVSYTDSVVAETFKCVHNVQLAGAHIHDS